MPEEQQQKLQKTNNKRDKDRRRAKAGKTTNQITKE
jgi:hypothetical protein